MNFAFICTVVVQADCKEETFINAMPLHRQKARIHIRFRSVHLQWSYISCNWQSTNFVFHQITLIYLPKGVTG